MMAGGTTLPVRLLRFRWNPCPMRRLDEANGLGDFPRDRLEPPSQPIVADPEKVNVLEAALEAEGEDEVDRKRKVAELVADFDRLVEEA
ncbi:hypothetical protein K2X89_13265 [Myxococcota bacterium]|nr:hypothetical protein [Myxococcota bacterium]